MDWVPYVAQYWIIKPPNWLWEKLIVTFGKATGLKWYKWTLEGGLISFSLIKTGSHSGSTKNVAGKTGTVMSQSLFRVNHIPFAAEVTTRMPRLPRLPRLPCCGWFITCSISFSEDSHCSSWKITARTASTLAYQWVSESGMEYLFILGKQSLRGPEAPSSDIWRAVSGKNEICFLASQGKDRYKDSCSKGNEDDDNIYWCRALWWAHYMRYFNPNEGYIRAQLSNLLAWFNNTITVLRVNSPSWGVFK